MSRTPAQNGSRSSILSASQLPRLFGCGPGQEYITIIQILGFLFMCLPSWLLREIKEMGVWGAQPKINKK